MINYQQIRSRLKHGDLSRIAKSLDIEQRIVSEVLNRGWHPRVKNAVMDEALKILEDESNGEADLAERADELQISSGVYNVPAKYHKKKSNPGNPGRGGLKFWMLLLFVPVILYLVLPQFKAWIDATWSKVTAGRLGGKLTAEQIDDIVSKGGAHKYV